MTRNLSSSLRVLNADNSAAETEGTFVLEALPRRTVPPGAVRIARMLAACRVSARVSGGRGDLLQFSTRECLSPRFFILQDEGHDLARVRVPRHVQFPGHREVRRGRSNNKRLAVEKYGIPIIHDRDAFRPHPHILRAPIEMTDNNAACRQSHSCEGGARDIVDPFGALCGCLEVKQSVMWTRPNTAIK